MTTSTDKTRRTEGEPDKVNGVWPPDSDPLTTASASDGATSDSAVANDAQAPASVSEPPAKTDGGVWPPDSEPVRTN